MLLPVGVALVQVHDDRAVQNQDGCGEHEACEVPSPKERRDEPDTEDHAHRREDHNDETQEIGAHVVPVTPGHRGANRHVDPVYDRQADADHQRNGRGVVCGAEVTGRDQDDPERQERQQVEWRLRLRHVGSEPTARVVRIRVAKRFGVG